MDLTQIRYFLVLARTLNFTRAAEECHVTQPALTKSIQRLEHELGGLLLLRERSLTQLTGLGRSMLPFLEQAFGAAQQAKEHAGSLRRRPAAPLRVGFAPGIPTAPFVPVFAELAARLSDFRLVLSSAGESALFASLLHSELDAAVLPGDVALPDRLNRWVLFRDRVVALVPEGGGGRMHVAALAGRAVICGDADGIRQRTLLRLEQTHGAGCRAPHAAGLAEQAVSLARAGLAIPLSTARTARLDGLRPCPLDGVDTDFDVLVATVAGRPHTLAADAFLKLTRARGWEGPAP